MKIPATLVLLLALAVPFAGAAGATEEAAAAYTQQALAAAQKGDLAEAVTLAGKAIKEAPTEPRAWMLRARLYDAQREYGKAVSDYSEAIKLAPKTSDAWQRRGEAQFRAGKITECLADFDRYLELQPSERPYHWQRGIALYYAGRFADGQKQFELHQTVNTQDVENAVWHFLCTARAEGLPAAEKKLIPIDADARVPMAQVHRLFAGKATTQDVLAAAEAAPRKTEAGEPLFYAHLYLGIYFEAKGRDAEAREHIFKAAERANENGYMGDVARVHAGILRKKKAP